MEKKALYSLSYGLYVVSSRLGDRINGQIANTVFQVTSEPTVLAVCLNKDNLTHAFIQESGVLAVSVLERETPLELVGLFGFKSGREVEKFAGIAYRRGVTEAPLLLEHSLAFLEAEVKSQYALGTHTLFCAGLADCGILQEGEPLTYAYYQAVKKGRAPKSAPTYLEGAEEKREAQTGSASGPSDVKYRCTVCGYIYDPSRGDPESGIPRGTPFDALPESWLCPVCGAAKEAFESI